MKMTKFGVNEGRGASNEPSSDRGGKGKKSSKGAAKTSDTGQRVNATINRPRGGKGKATKVGSKNSEYSAKCTYADYPSHLAGEDSEENGKK